MKYQCVLEVATAILSHYVRSGERLYPDDPWTWTRFQAMEDNKCPVVVGGFSSRGLDVSDDYVAYYGGHGVAGLRRY